MREVATFMSAPEFSRWCIAKASERLQHHDGIRPLSSANQVTSFAGKVTGIASDRLNDLYMELRAAPFQQAIKALVDIDPNSHIGIDECLYVLCRAIRPQIVIETGVFHGVSSTYILSALHRNEAGHLISIDVPAPSLGDRDVGWFVPAELRSRWTLMLGSSYDLLPGILGSAGGVDIFFHDSEHSEKCMLFEYNLLWPRIISGGLLLSDDVDWSTAFSKFYAYRNECSNRSLCFGYRMGGLRKK
jgi:predicted O-methyltransferase YrrM